MLAVELTTLPYPVMDDLPEKLLQDMLLYKNVKHVTENGGNYDP
jgi:hypothetical protein